MTTGRSEYGGVLLLRVWSETGTKDGVRIRVVGCEPPLPPEVLAAAAEPGGVLDLVQAWLQTLYP